jgi:hypothetical protein
MMAVSVAKPSQPGKPAPLFSFDRGGLFLSTPVFTPYAVAPGGTKFFAINQLPRKTPPVTQVNVVVNWVEDLKRRGLIR